MIINLAEKISPSEFIRLKVVKNVEEPVGKINFSFSREAIIGFSTELLLLYDDIDCSRQMSITTHPLAVDPAPNQSIGFYLTPSSPDFMIKINTLQNESELKLNDPEKMQEIFTYNKKGNEYYYVNTDLEELGEEIIIEPYELSKRNILNISIENQENNDITSECRAIVLEINKNGIKDFAISLLKWANNLKNKDEYLISREDCKGTNFGVILTQDSPSFLVNCKDLGTVYEYDSRFC